MDSREIWLMRTELNSQLTYSFPDSFEISNFQVGKDETGWLTANASAFAEHPEQGDMSLEQLHENLNSFWFDPKDFFLVRESNKIIVFVWVKIHIERPVPDAEIFIIGLIKEFQGKGLGASLLSMGLNHIRKKGFNEAIIYVDAPNKPALTTYQKFGFKHISTQHVSIKKKLHHE
jgi:mycothiol synthase